MSKLNLVKFERKNEQSLNQQKVVRLLEEAVTAAKEGRYSSLALIMIGDDGDVLDCWHNGGRPYVILGAIEALKADFITANIEPR